MPAWTLLLRKGKKSTPLPRVKWSWHPMIPGWEITFESIIDMESKRPYGHLSKILVRYGQEVKRGDVLGRVGSTGRFSTGPHLHYQVAVNDKVVDPLQYVLD